jgi:hypothetical protein
MEMDDDEVPELVTLDEHLSDEVQQRLTGLSGNKNNSEEELVAEGDKTKVPITILTGLCLS